MSDSVTQTGVPAEAAVPEQDAPADSASEPEGDPSAPAPLHVPRPPDRRVVGTCRHWATLATALLRERGIPARARSASGIW